MLNRQPKLKSSFETRKLWIAGPFDGNYFKCLWLHIDLNPRFHNLFHSDHMQSLIKSVTLRDSDSASNRVMSLNDQWELDQLQ